MQQTLLFDDRPAVSVDVSLENDSVWLDAGDLERATGFHLEERGVCRGATCIPVPPGARWVADGRFDLGAFAAHRGQGHARDESAGVWAVGPPEGVRFADGLAPDFELPDFSGRLHTLSQYRGKKVLLMTWASW